VGPNSYPIQLRLPSRVFRPTRLAYVFHPNALIARNSACGRSVVTALDCSPRYLLALQPHSLYTPCAVSTVVIGTRRQAIVRKRLSNRARYVKDVDEPRPARGVTSRVSLGVTFDPTLQLQWRMNHRLNHYKAFWRQQCPLPVLNSDLILVMCNGSTISHNGLRAIGQNPYHDEKKSGSLRPLWVVCRYRKSGRSCYVTPHCKRRHTDCIILANERGGHTHCCALQFEMTPQFRSTLAPSP